MTSPTMLQVLYGGLGGHASVAFALVQGDERRRVHHSLLFFGIEDVRPEYVHRCEELEVDHASVVKHRGLDLKSWREVWDAFHRIAPDVVVLHSMTLLPVAMVYGRLTGTRVLYVDHQSNDLKGPKEWAMTAMAAVFGSKLILLTERSADEVRSALGPLCRDEKVFVVNNGIDVERYSPCGRPSERRETTITMQSRFTEIKDHPTLVRAFAKLVQMRPEEPLKLVLAGDGETRREIQALVDDLSISGQVEMPGMLNELELVECLRNTDIYVHSTAGETMSMAVMQAMSTGLAVIGSDVSGVNNMVEPGLTGALFPAGDADRLAEILCDCLDEPEKYASMGARARAVALERFSQVAMFERYAELTGLVD